MLTSSQQENPVTDHLSELQDLETEGYERVVRRARNALFVAGILIFFGEMISMYQLYAGFNAYVFTIAIVEAGIFIALGFYTAKKPYTAIVLGLTAFSIVILASMILNGMGTGAEGLLKALFSGIIVKVAILISLIRPLKDAKELQKIKEEKKILGIIN